MKTIKLQESTPQKHTSVDEMSMYQLCRWAALKEAVDILGEKCEEKNMELTSDVLQPLEILQYVETVTDSLYSQVLASNNDEK